jgi:hypothetical protein
MRQTPVSNDKKMRTKTSWILLALLALISYSVQSLSVSNLIQHQAATNFHDLNFPQNIQVLADGSKYIHGMFMGSVTIGNQTYTASSVAVFTFDFYLVKYNPEGTIAFVKIIPFALAGSLIKASVASDGSFYVGVKNFVAKTIDAQAIPSTEALLIRYDAAGTYVWHRRATSASTLFVNMATLSDNSVVVVTQTILDSTWSDGTNVPKITDNNESTKIRFATDGTKIWALRTDASSWGNDYYSVGIAVYNDNIYINHFCRRDANGWDSMLEKVTPAGAQNWIVRMTTNDRNVQLASVAADDSGNVYVAGSFTGSAKFPNVDSTFSTLIGTSVTGTFLVKYSSIGYVQWMKQMQSTVEIINAPSNGLAVNRQYVVVVGQNTASFNYDGNSITYAGADVDAYIITADKDTGNMIQSNVIASTGKDTVAAITKSVNGFEVLAIAGGNTTIGSTAVTPTAAALLAYHFEDNTCYSFQSNQYGAKKPVVTASTAGGQSIAISVTMYRQSYDNLDTPVYHRLDTTTLNNNVCISSGADQIVPSAQVAWIHTGNGCSDTYTLTQNVADIVNAGKTNNNWASQLDGTGREITYTLPVYATYSVNRDGSCFYVGYKYDAVFKTALSVATSSAEFYDVDNAFKFTLAGLRVTSSNNLVIEGNTKPLIPGGELRNIIMKKVAGSIPFNSSVTICSDSTSGCANTFTATLSSLGSAGQDISGSYSISADSYESGALTLSGVAVYMTISYSIPSDPTIVSSDTITTNLKVFTDGSYLTERSTSITSSQTLYVQNSISDSSPAIPASLRLRMSEGYLCCVAYPSAITPYSLGLDSGGCKDPNGKTEYVNLGTEGTHGAGIVQTSADSVKPKRYQLQIALGTVFSSTNHPNALTCQVLLISKLGQDGSRRINDNSMNSTFVSTMTIDVQAKPALSASPRTAISLIVVILSAVMFLALQ